MRHVTRMTLDDAEHIGAQQREAIIASYPPHERTARVEGIPALGSGRVYPVAEEDIVCKPFAIPEHYAQIAGIDFGWDHPTASVKLAHDRDADVLYLTHDYRLREQPPYVHAVALKPWGDGLPWAWPQDAYQRDKRAGGTLKDDYAKHGLKMLPHHAILEDGSVSVETGIMRILERMQTQRFKVFSTCGAWIEEFRLYHRNDGLIVKEMDDLMDATRYAVMMLRFAVAGRERITDRYRRDRNEGSGGSWMSA